MAHLRFPILILGVVSVLVTLPCSAQEVTGAVVGVVRDASGSVIPGAAVEVQNEETNAVYTGSTSDIGFYSFRGLPVGIYKVRVESAGFRTHEATGIQTQVNESARVDVTLSIGEVTETVEVAAEVIGVDTQTATLKTVVDQRRVEGLPLNGRDPIQLMRLVAGVSIYRGAGVTSGTTYPGVTPVSVNGSRGNATNYVLDGGQNNDHYSNAPVPLPNPDALQEFSVQTNNFSAEFGRNSGGIVNAVTKSGTNELHGSGFLYMRHHNLNAAQWNAPPDPDDPSKKANDGLKRNQYGGTVGGPVLRDKTFFFFSFQGTQIRRRPNQINRNTFTALERQGDFSQSGIGRDIMDPMSGMPFSGMVIPRSRLFPGSVTFANEFLPVPTGGGRRTTVTQVANFDENQTLFKIDQQAGSKVRISGRASWNRAAQPGNLNQSNIYEDTTQREWNNTSVVGNVQWIVSPTTLNQTIFGISRMEGPSKQILPDRNWNDLGVNITLDEFTQYHTTFQTINGPNTGDTNNFLRDEWQFSNTTRLTKGRHSLTFGGEWGHGIGDITNNFRAQGRFRWRHSAGYTGLDIADFMLGRFERFQQGVGEFKNTRFDIFALFANDSVKLSPSVTLDLGVRWEPFFPYTDTLGKLAAWRGVGHQSTRFVNAPEGVLYPGDQGLPDGGYNAALGNLGPRLGLAWDITGDGKTSLRLGYGVFYDRSNTISTNSQANQGPFGTVVTIFGGPNDTMANPYASFSGGNPFPVIGFDAVGTELLDPPSDAPFIFPHRAHVYALGMRNAYMQSWNLTLERLFARNWVARLSYAGSAGDALVSGRDINAPLPDATASTSTTNQRRPAYPIYERITLIEPTGFSRYSALQATLEKRMSQGFTVLANYTLAQTTDNNRGSANKATGTSVTNPLDQSYDEGPADYHLRHVVNFSGIWALPNSFTNPAARFLIGGWTLTSIANWRSGFPFTVLSDTDNARTGQGGQRAEVVATPFLGDDRPRSAVVDEYLNRAAFTPNILGTYGTQARNGFRGPRSFNFDFGLHKDFPVTESFGLQFRFEAFNLLNNVNLGHPEVRLGRGNFMEINSAADPRILQFALRASF